MIRWRYRAASAALALLVAAQVPADAQALKTPTAADFGALPIVTTPALSPDGMHAAARGRANGKTIVLVLDLAVGGSSARTLPIPDNFQFEWLRWAGNGKLLVSVSRMDKLFDEDVRITRLIAFDVASGKASLVGPKEQGVDGDDLIHVDSEGRFVLLSTQASIYDYPSVFRVDLTTGKSEKVVRAQTDVWNWFADPSGVVRAGMGVSGNRWWLIYRARDGESFTRTVKRSASGEDADIDKFLPVDGSDNGYAVANTLHGRFGLFRYDFKGDKLGELLYENPTVDIDDFTLGQDGGLLSVEYVDDRPEIAWFDPELKKLQAKVDRALPSMTNRVVSVSRDRMRLLVSSVSADDPGTVYLYDRKSNRMDPFARPYAALEDKRLASMEAVRYKARDGLEIRGYLTLPPGRDPAKLPLVVMPHGGPFARDQWGYDPWVQYLASKGYAVLQPNFRGSTGFGRAFVERGTGAWGRGMQDDIDDGVKWLADRGTVDLKRVCIMGASFGGYASMWAAVRNPELYRCAISFAGISDVASMLRYDRKSFSAPRYFRDWRQRVQGDKSFELDQISPIKSVEKLIVPILIAHGDKDDNVPLYQSRRLHEALLKLKRDHEYVVYPGEGHGFDDPAHSTDFLNRVGAFLDEHNPAQ